MKNDRRFLAPLSCFQTPETPPAICMTNEGTETMPGTRLRNTPNNPVGRSYYVVLGLGVNIRRLRRRILTSTVAEAELRAA